MILIDTSILVPVLRDKSGAARDRLRRFLQGRDFVLTRFTQIELLQGAVSENQWDRLATYLEVQSYADARSDTWESAARIYFELGRKGMKVASILDCCIAQVAIEGKLTLVHNDRDFERIAKVRPLRSSRFDIQARN
jgi:hypothetical protein